MTGKNSNTPGDDISPRKAWLWLGVVAVVAIVALAVLPIAVSRVATSWLQGQGAAGASIDNLDINLFTGIVRVEGLEAGAGPTQRLHVGMAEVHLRWMPLASKRILVEAIGLSDTQVDITFDGQDTLQVGGLQFSLANTSNEPEPETDTDGGDFDWGLGSENIELANVSLTFTGALFETDVEIDTLAVGSHSSWQAGESTDVIIDMVVNGAPLNLRSDVVPWGEQRSVSGALMIEDHPLDDHATVLQSLFGLEGVQGSLSLDLVVTASLDATNVLDLSITGPISLADAGVGFGSSRLSNGQLDWEGLIDLKLPAPDNEALLDIDGSLQLANTRVVLEDQQLDASLRALALTADLALFDAGNTTDLPGLQMEAALEAEGLNLVHGNLPFALARLESLGAGDVLVNDLGRVSVGELQLGGLELLAGDLDDGVGDALFTLGTLDLAGVAFDGADPDLPPNLLVESVSLEAPHLSLVRNPEGNFVRVDELLAVYASEEDAGPGGEPGAETASGLPLTFAVNRVQVTADNLLAFRDLAVMPPVNFQLTSFDLSVTDIDSSSPEPMTVMLETGNGTTALNASGTVSAFTESPGVNLELALSALDLSRFGSYVPGYNIERGRLGSDSTVIIEGDILDMQNSVLLEGIQLTNRAAEGNAVLAQGMAMPLDVALDLLRDSDDRIRLDLPVTGSLSDPQFDSADIVRTVMQNALQNAAMSYVTNALQPLGTLLLVRDLASQAAAPRFAPLEQVTGEASLSPENRDYLLKIGELLNERPSLSLTVCGIATAGDREALAAMALAQLRQEMEAAAAAAAQDEGVQVPAPVPEEPGAPQISDSDLLGLAAQRTSVATDYLVSEVGIAQERLFTCRETIDGDAEGLPGVRLSL